MIRHHLYACFYDPVSLDSWCLTPVMIECTYPTSPDSAKILHVTCTDKAAWLEADCPLQLALTLTAEINSMDLSALRSYTRFYQMDCKQKIIMQTLSIPHRSIFVSYMPLNDNLIKHPFYYSKIRKSHDHTDYVWKLEGPQHILQPPMTSGHALEEELSEMNPMLCVIVHLPRISGGSTAFEMDNQSGTFWIWRLTHWLLTWQMCCIE